MSSRRILFVGGGSGGHVAPLIAVMQALHDLDPQAELHYAGLSSDVQSGLVAATGLPVTIHTITAGKLNRFMTWKHLPQLGQFIRGLLQGWKLVGRLRPTVIMAKGGFVSVPVALAAGLRGIPVLSHESDAILGLANRLIARVACRIFTAYPTAGYTGLPTEKLRYVGQPVRAEFYQDSHELRTIENRELNRNLPLITVTGGSQGARRLNELVSGAWPQLLKKTQIVHLSGAADYHRLEELARTLPEEIRERLYLFPFLKTGLPALLRASTVVVSRAGGMVAELAACRVPVILLPLSTSAQGHQEANARTLASKGAALVLDERHLTVGELVETILSLLSDPERCRALSQAISTYDHPNAAREMAQELAPILEKDPETPYI